MNNNYQFDKISRQLAYYPNYLNNYISISDNLINMTVHGATS